MRPRITKAADLPRKLDAVLDDLYARLPGSENFNFGAAAAAAATAGARRSVELLDFTSGWTNSVIADPAAFSADTATVAAHKVSWASGFASGQRGIFFDSAPAAGDYYEATFVMNGPGNSAGFVAADLVGVGKRWSGFVKALENPAKFYRYMYGAGAAPGKALPNGQAYGLSALASGMPGSLTLGLRFPSLSTAEIYANGLLIHRETLDVTLAKFGFSMSWHLSAYTSIENPFRIRNWTPQFTRPLAVACLGDSITVGAYARVGWPSLLPYVAQNLPGIGELTVTNRAVSGYSAASFASVIGSYDFSGFDAVLVMLGTNDVQGLRSVSAYLADMTTIRNRIVAGGAVPIFGIFPLYTTASVSGNAGVATTAYSRPAIYQSELLKWIVQNGDESFDARESFGANYKGPGAGWYIDNLHPTEEGAVAIAKAAAAALVRVFGPKAAS